MDDGTSGSGRSYFAPIHGKYCTITYLDETYSFFEPDNGDRDDEPESYVDYHLEKINHHLEHVGWNDYHDFYTDGKIILKGSHYYFVDEATETQTRLALDAGFFYQYGGETLSVSETIRSGACLLYGKIAADSPYMVIYLD